MADLAAAVVEQEPQQRRDLISDAFRRYRAEHEDKTPYRSYRYDSTGETIIDNWLYDDIAEHIGEVRGKVVEFRRKLKAILNCRGEAIADCRRIPRWTGPPVNCCSLSLPNRRNCRFR